MKKIKALNLNAETPEKSLCWIIDMIAGNGYITYVTIDSSGAISHTAGSSTRFICLDDEYNFSEEDMVEAKRVYIINTLEKECETPEPQGEVIIGGPPLGGSGSPYISPMPSSTSYPNIGTIGGNPPRSISPNAYDPENFRKELLKLNTRLGRY